MWSETSALWPSRETPTNLALLTCPVASSAANRFLPNAFACGDATVYRGELMRITSPFNCAATWGNDLLDLVDRLLGLRRADHVRLRAQPVERRRDKHDRDDNGNSPERQRPARMRRARPCKPLGHRGEPNPSLLLVALDDLWRSDRGHVCVHPGLAQSTPLA